MSAAFHAEVMCGWKQFSAEWGRYTRSFFTDILNASNYVFVDVETVMQAAGLHPAFTDMVVGAAAGAGVAADAAGELLLRNLRAAAMHVDREVVGAAAALDGSPAWQQALAQAAALPRSGTGCVGHAMLHPLQLPTSLAQGLPPAAMVRAIAVTALLARWQPRDKDNRALDLCFGRGGPPYVAARRALDVLPSFSTFRLSMTGLLSCTLGHLRGMNDTWDLQLASGQRGRSLAYRVRHGALTAEQVSRLADGLARVAWARAQAEDFYCACAARLNGHSEGERVRLGLLMLQVSTMCKPTLFKGF
jgi:hypothetical protein